MKFKGSVEVNPRVKTISKAFDLNGRDMRVMATRVGVQFRKHERRLFSTEGASGGTKWAPLSPRYAKQKRRKYGAKKIMNRKGNLRGSLVSPGHPNHVLRWGTVPQAFISFGTADTVGAYHIKASPLYNRNLPERDVMQSTPQQDRSLLQIVRDYMVKEKLARLARAMSAWSKSRGR